jgi:glyoxylase-like metal-dependent hydrolase (beta-lactamase superfamily II)
MILEIFCSGPALTNCVLVGCPKTREAAIIDVPFDSSDQLLDAIDSLNLSVKMILLTHSHWDHIGDVKYLKKKLKVPVSIHEEDAENLKIPGSDGLPLFQEVKGVIPDHLLKDGEKIKIGELEAEVIHTPGHTPGGVCFYFPKESLLIAGDTLFKGTIGNLSFPTSDPSKMWDSLKRLSGLPKETRVISGHGEETQIGREKWLANAREYFGG